MVTPMDFFQNKVNQISFIKENWEKKPIVLRNIIPNAEKIIAQDELIEMATDDYFISRLITQHKNEWTVTDGPFEKGELNQRSSDKWTLVNHNVNLYNEKIHKIQRSLEFLPAWLFDDGMTTLSTKGSSVGAHIDNYNVFIIQLSGSRKWQIQNNPKKKFQEGLPVKILEEFEPDEEYILEPGDMIYIPPHVAHHGISLEDSLSLSMGFKSIEFEDLLKTMAVEILEEEKDLPFFKTEFDKPTTEDSLIIDSKNLNKIKKALIDQIENSTWVEDSLLKFASKSKGLFDENDELEFKEFEELFKGNDLVLDEFCKFSVIKRDSKTLSLGINGSIFNINPKQYVLIKKMQQMLPQSAITHDQFGEISDLLFSFYLDGYCGLRED